TGHRLQKLEILELNGMGMGELARNMQYRRRKIDVAGGAAKAHRNATACFHTLQLFQKIDVEKGSPEFAVGDAVQAQVFLKAHDFTDRMVLDRAQLLLRDGTAAEPNACLQQVARAQETADVIGAKGRTGRLHGAYPIGGTGNDPTPAVKKPGAD